MSLSQNKKSIILSIADNGIVCLQKQKGPGIDYIKSEAAAYNGTADFVSQPGRGCV
jgi:signal transduction histidine kinase